MAEITVPPLNRDGTPNGLTRVMLEILMSTREGRSRAVLATFRANLTLEAKAAKAKPAGGAR